MRLHGRFQATAYKSTSYSVLSLRGYQVPTESQKLMAQGDIYTSDIINSGIKVRLIHFCKQNHISRSMAYNFISNGWLSVSKFKNKLFVSVIDSISLRNYLTRPKDIYRKSK